MLYVGMFFLYKHAHFLSVFFHPMPVNLYMELCYTESGSGSFKVSTVQLAVVSDRLLFHVISLASLLSGDAGDGTWDFLHATLSLAFSFLAGSDRRGQRGALEQHELDGLLGRDPPAHPEIHPSFRSRPKHPESVPETGCSQP